MSKLGKLECRGYGIIGLGTARSAIVCVHCVYIQRVLRYVYVRSVVCLCVQELCVCSVLRVHYPTLVCVHDVFVCVHELCARP